MREKQLKTSKIFKIIEKTAPLSLAEPWDNSGLQLGSYNDDVSKIMTCLDITDRIAKEAIEEKVNLILTHHPIFFEGVKQLDRSGYKGQMVTELLKNNVTVYAAHTNLDKAYGGLNDYVAALIELEATSPLVPEYAEFYKIVAYAPKTHTQNILEGLKSLEPPFVSGNYKDCTFRSQGIGTFTPLISAEPFIGEHGQLTEVEETKIEMTVKKYQVKAALDAIKRNHPYEEAVIDIYALENRYLPSRHGLGRKGRLKEPMAYSDFVSFLKKRLDLTSLRECGPPPASVHKIALCTGSGSNLMLAAKSCGVDLYITGDMKYHDAQKAYENGICVLDCGHYGTEKFASDILLQILKKDKIFSEKEIEVIPSKSSSDFFKRI